MDKEIVNNIEALNVLIGHLEYLLEDSARMMLNNECSDVRSNVLGKISRAILVELGECEYFSSNLEEGKRISKLITLKGNE
mgnify:CR=1 FL=1